MTFSSITFLFYFLPLTLALYFATPWKNAALFAASLLFYAWGEPVYVVLLLASIALNHAFAGAIARTRNPALFWAGIAANLAAIIWFKYAGFAMDALARLISRFGVELAFDAPTHLPLGISFFTFQAISLLIDIRRGDAAAPKSVLDTGLYIAFFPQLIAGPIVRFKSICEQIKSRRHDLEKFSAGAMVFTLGLAQKTLLANSFAPIADAAFDLPEGAGLSAAAAWTGLLAYSLQIYFDFAGYSNMAIGMGRMFGFELPRNFDYPYTAQSVTEFWRRWHMTLSQWFRDYLYIPLGGNRGPRWRTYANLWIVFLLCGLWHGASVNFVLWGAWHGAFLCLERAILEKRLNAAPALLRRLYLVLAVMLGWTLFRAETLADAGAYWRSLVGMGEGALFRVGDIAPDGALSIFILGVLVAQWPVAGAPLVRLASMRAARFAPARGDALYVWSQLAIAALLIASAATLAGGAYNPFIYFRF